MGGWFGSQGGCERRIKKKLGGGRVGGVGLVGWVDGNKELKFL